jgi:predicted DNA-binding transcriptional regulator
MNDNAKDKLGIADDRRPGWFWMDNSILKSYGRKLKPVNFMIYATLVMYANRARTAWPSYAKMVELTGLSRRSVINAINELENLGLIRRIQSDTRGNIYAINDPAELVHHMHQQAPASARNVTSSAPHALELVQNDRERNYTNYNTNNKKGSDKQKNTKLQSEQAAPTQNGTETLKTQTTHTEAVESTENAQMGDVSGEGYKHAQALAVKLRERRLQKAKRTQLFKNNDISLSTGVT